MGGGDRASGGITGREHSRLLQQLAGRRHPVGEGRHTVLGAQESPRLRLRDAAAAAKNIRGAVLGIYLATRKGVVAAEKSHALLPANHVDLGGRAGSRADEKDGGGRLRGDGGHGAGARERRSSASCSMSASAETGLATTRSTNWLPSWAATLSPHPVRRKTGVSGDRALTRSATSQPFILGMPRSVMTTSCLVLSNISSASSPLTAVVTE